MSKLSKIECTFAVRSFSILNKYAPIDICVRLHTYCTHIRVLDLSLLYEKLSNFISIYCVFFWFGDKATHQ